MAGVVNLLLAIRRWRIVMISCDGGGSGDGYVQPYVGLSAGKGEREEEWIW
jgi:hypothetical protein